MVVARPAWPQIRQGGQKLSQKVLVTSTDSVSPSCELRAREIAEGSTLDYYDRESNDDDPR